MATIRKRGNLQWEARIWRNGYPCHARLSVTRLCALLTIARSGLYYEKTGESSLNLALMQEIDRVFIEWPFVAEAETRAFTPQRLAEVLGWKQPACF